MLKEASRGQTDPAPYRYAEAIVNLCYNDTVDGESIRTIFENYGELTRSLMMTIAFLFVSELFTSALTKIFPGLLSLGDALSGIGRLLLDSGKVLGGRAATHVNPNVQRLDYREEKNTGVHIDYVATPALKAYIKAYREGRTRGSERFADSDLYPLAHLEDPAVPRKLVRLEELFHYLFGVAYRSGYNTLHRSVSCWLWFKTHQNPRRGSSFTSSRPSRASRTRASTSRGASASSTFRSLGWVQGCRGVKTVQQSS